MKKMILCVLLLTALGNPTFSQADSTANRYRSLFEEADKEFDKGQVRIWITPEQETKVFRDRAIIKAQGKKIGQQNASIDSLHKAHKELNEIIRQQRQELGRINKLLYRDSAKISSLQEKLDKEAKLTAGYRALAKKLSYQLTAMKKWRGKYYSLASITVLKISIPIAAFLAGTYFIMQSIK